MISISQEQHDQAILAARAEYAEAANQLQQQINDLKAQVKSLADQLNQANLDVTRYSELYNSQTVLVAALRGHCGDELRSALQNHDKARTLVDIREQRAQLERQEAELLKPST